MNGNVEDIIKNKQYFELSSEELSAVSEYAQTETEYEDMKWFLLNVGEAMEGAKIEASVDLKGRVMERLTESKKESGSWMNSMTVFLFPEDKRFYQKPAFQMFAAAAVIVAGIFIIDPFSEMDENAGLAVNDSKQEETIPTGEGTAETAEEDPAVDDATVLDGRAAHEPARETESVTIVNKLEKELEDLKEDPAFARYIDDAELEAQPMEELTEEDEEMDGAEFYFGDNSSSTGENNNTVNNIPAGTNRNNANNTGGTIGNDKDYRDQIEDQPSDDFISVNQEQSKSTMGGYKKDKGKDEDLKKQKSSGKKENKNRADAQKKLKNIDNNIAANDRNEAERKKNQNDAGNNNGNINDPKAGETRIAAEQQTLARENEVVSEITISSADEKTELASSTDGKFKEKVVSKTEDVDADGAGGLSLDLSDEEGEKESSGKGKKKALSISTTTELKGLFYTIK